MVNRESIQDIIFRSSFLSERVINTSLAIPTAYAEKIADLKANLSHATPQAKKYLEGIEQSLTCVSVEYQNSTIPGWYHFIIDCLEQEKLTFFKTEKKEESYPFTLIFAPFLNIFERKVSDFLDKKKISYEPKVIEDASNAIMEDFLELAGLTIYCQLKDECPELTIDKYHEWCNDYVKTRWPKTILEYPILGRYVYERFQQFFDNFAEMMVRFENDKSLLLTAGLITSLDTTLTHIQFSLSDRHNNAQRVCILKLKDGSSIVYKPKALRNEVWFQKLISHSEINRKQTIGRAQVLDLGTYGWVEDVFKDIAHNKISSLEEVEESYACVAALAYLINASDLHAENVIIKNDAIYIIDLETIFCFPILLDNGKCDPDWRNFSILNSELFRTSLQKNLKILGNIGIFTETMDSPRPLYFLRKCEKEGIKIQFTGKSGKRNIKAGKPQESDNEHVIDVKKFRYIFEEECKSLKEFLSRPELLDEIDNLECRLVPRATVFYRRLFQRLYHPDFLRDGALLSFETLGLLTTLPKKTNDFSDKCLSLIIDEIRQIENGDVPYFYYHPGDTTLYSKQGIIHPQIFSPSPRKFFTEKIHGATMYEFKEQSGIIETSMLSANTNKESLAKPYNNIVMSEGHLSQNIIKSCKNCAYEIISVSYSAPDTMARWVNYNYDENKTSLLPCSGQDHYYGGYWGIMVFLSAAEYTFIQLDVECKNLAHFLEGQISYWKNNVPTPDNLPFIDTWGLSGIGGKLKAWSTLLRLDHKRWGFLKERFSKTLELVLNEPISSEDLFDYYAGPGSLIPLFIHIEQNIGLYGINTTQKDKIKKFLFLLTQNMSDGFEHYLNGDESEPDKKNLVGFSHGNAGLIFSFLKLLEFNPNESEKLTRMISQLLDFDDTCKCDGGLSWLDNRTTDEKRPVNRSWCHGLSGIGLSRLLLLSSNSFRERAFLDLKIVLLAILNQQSKQEHDFFCCGETGEIDFLIEVSRFAGLEHYDLLVKERLTHLTTTILKEKKFDGLVTDASNKNSPGLFQGGAGIGYTMLRILNKELPSLVI